MPDISIQNYHSLSLQPALFSDREVIARLRNCVVGLAEHRMLLYDTSILYTYEASASYDVSLDLPRDNTGMIKYHVQMGESLLLQCVKSRIYCNKLYSYYNNLSLIFSNEKHPEFMGHPE